MSAPGGRYDFDDGGSYCGGWDEGKAHGHGVCTGPKGQGEYSGAWANGFEASGVYLWPSGNTFEGQWQQGKRHGLGVEKKDKWTYQGEWTQGFKGRYGVRHSNTSAAKYEGTWDHGLQDGYGCETYADGGTYHGQWQRGTRHGYGVRQSVPYGEAAHHRTALTTQSSQQSLQQSEEEEEDKAVKIRDKKINETRGGFILTSKSEPTTSKLAQHGKSSSRLMSLFDRPVRSMKHSLKAAGAKLRKQRSANDVSDDSSLRSGKLSSSMRSTRSFVSQKSTTSSIASTSASKASLDDDRSFYSQDDITDATVTERYCGEWSGDKRCGFGVSERSDGLKYEGEWYNNRKHGYGTTTRKDGTTEDGKYKNNVLVSSTSTTKARLLILQRNKLTERIAASVEAARRAAQLAMQKVEVAISRMANARSKAEQAAAAAEKAVQESNKARLMAAQLDPKFHQPGTTILKKRLQESFSVTSDSGVRGRMAQTAGGQLRGAAAQQITGTAAADGRPNGVLPGSAAGALDSVMPRSAFSGGRSSQPVTPEVSPTHGLWFDQQPQQMTLSGRPSDASSQALLVDHFDHYETLARSATAKGKNGNTGDSGLLEHGRPRAMLRPDIREPAATANDSMGLAMMAAPALLSIATTDDDQRIRNDPAELPRSRSGGFAADGRIQPRSFLDRLPGNGLGKSPAAQPSMQMHRSKDDGALTARGYGSASPSHTVYRANHMKTVTGRAAFDTRKDWSSGGRADLPVVGSNLASSRKQRGSLPDVSAIRDMSALSKEELHRLSAERRDEIRKLLDENERRRNGDIGILFGDMKRWLEQRKLIMLVVAINVSLVSILFGWWI